MPAERFVSRPRAFLVCYRVLLQQMLRPSRWALGIFGLVMMGLGLALGLTDNIDDRLEVATWLVSVFGLTVILPVVALIFGSMVLGETQEDGTLVYLWLRPMDRSPVVVAAFCAALTAVLPLAVVPVTLSGLLVGGGADLAWSAVLSTLVGAAAYVALFLLLGLLVKHSVVWGLAYILIWEGIAAIIGTAASRLTVRGYTRSIIEQITRVDLELEPVSTLTAVIVCLAVCLVALTLATLRLNRIDVA